MVGARHAVKEALRIIKQWKRPPQELVRHLEAAVERLEKLPKVMAEWRDILQADAVYVTSKRMGQKVKVPKKWRCPCGGACSNCICGSWHLRVGEPCRRFSLSKVGNA